ncbi:TPA: lpg2539 family Dot/Icm T4SS effector [Legionella pneumophila]|nr:lpg2539 family Dot/Icm T4SS effector [Legionella pneumophila]MDW8878042.1 lpg2539 family Dot/Icm T4SS effector [Legionella pneumophila subsp. fraseri]MDW8962406.1 lpg2539 family Dot/Icm T4SS effector [Legionella pneumophila subsp. fraseri]MDW9036057.1 lpg2539 family Dot/Icm T4SS effector [Legionella pneumophila subsp. fraseri]MDW9038637.1 lpg2539 family Dot/Icm T4SS effector [Legionella pneumophila subsp. fraseri]MDW9042515.1 lpg2539 family Dot/Icm T4SS effector [Legionella pneumophila subs
MKLIINKKNRAESMALDVEATTTVNELLLILYTHRSKRYEPLSFSEYQKFISVYQCLLYGDQFINKLLPGTNLADYQLEDPCHLTWEEFTEKQCLLADAEASRILLWQANKKASKPEMEKDLMSVASSDAMNPDM